MGTVPADIDVDDVLTGPWDERKLPSSVVNRQFLADYTRALRRGMLDVGPLSVEDLAAIRKQHRRIRSELLLLDGRALDLRRASFQLITASAAPKGGVE